MRAMYLGALAPIRPVRRISGSSSHRIGAPFSVRPGSSSSVQRSPIAQNARKIGHQATLIPGYGSRPSEDIRRLRYTGGTLERPRTLRAAVYDGHSHGDLSDTENRNAKPAVKEYLSTARALASADLPSLYQRSWFAGGRERVISSKASATSRYCTRIIDSRR